MRDLWDLITGASWVARQAAKDALVIFKRRLVYWWRQRSHRETVDMVESWWKHPETCPF